MLGAKMQKLKVFSTTVSLLSYILTRSHMKDVVACPQGSLCLESWDWVFCCPIYQSIHWRRGT